MKLEYSKKKDEIIILNRVKLINYGIKFNLKCSILIKDDNFNSLSNLLNNGYSNKIDLIYIDPPFATNNEFIVSDRVSTISRPKKGVVAYSDKISDDDFIEFIRERLIIMRELLSDKGSIYLHMDNEMGYYIKIIMDDIFGKENFINDITRKKGNPKNFYRKAYGNEKDVILFYAKNKGNHIWNDIKINYSKEEILKKYHKIDSNGRYYNTVPVHAPGESAGITGTKWRGVLPPVGRHWRTSPEELEKLDALGLIEWSKNNNPRLRKYADEHKGKKVQDIWLNYKDTFKGVYPTQKNYDMLDFIIKQSSDEKSIVLDAFAGSGTTLLAALNNNRTFIGIDESDIAISVIKERLNNKDSNIRYYDFTNIYRKNDDKYDLLISDIVEK